MKILVVDDDLRLNKIICNYLLLNGFQSVGCTNVTEAYGKLEEEGIDIIVSDIMMPGIDGFEFARNVRDLDSNIPILFISAKDDIASKKYGYDIGIDDYLTKPFELEELILKIKALIRRANIDKNRKLVIGNLTLDKDSLSAAIDGADVPITHREFRIISKLLDYPNKAFSRSQLLDEFWGYESESGPRSVDIYITRLREKFARCDGFEIVTVRGLGYKAVMK